MSVQRSTNCRTYTDTVSLLVGATATVPGREDACTVRPAPVFSCQTSAFEAPDADTEGVLRAAATEALEAAGCDAAGMALRFETNLVGARQTEYSGAKLAELGMASSCFQHGNDVNDATHTIRAKCRSMYDMIDANGNRVRDYTKAFLGNLSTCDVSDAAMPQLMEDARKVTAHIATTNGYTIPRDTDLACEFSVLPNF